VAPIAQVKERLLQLADRWAAQLLGDFLIDSLRFVLEGRNELPDAVQQAAAPAVQERFQAGVLPLKPRRHMDPEVTQQADVSDRPLPLSGDPLAPDVPGEVSQSFSALPFLQVPVPLKLIAVVSIGDALTLGGGRGWEVVCGGAEEAGGRGGGERKLVGGGERKIVCADGGADACGLSDFDVNHVGRRGEWGD
jgi:hypothetical protein